MNLKLRAVYFCAANNNRWGKGLTIKEAKKNAGIKTRADEKKCEYYVVAAIIDNPDLIELDKFRQCIIANLIDGTPYYYIDKLEEDSKMINDKHVGWLTIEKNF